MSVIQFRWSTIRSIALVLTLSCTGVLAIAARAQQQEPQDPEDEKQIGLWLDQGISTNLSKNRSLELEFHERFDEGASNLFDYFAQAGVAFRPCPWLTFIPTYRYERFPGNSTNAYENRLLFNTTLATSRGPWRYSMRTLIEGRFPDNTPASARIRLRPGFDYALPVRMSRPPVLGVTNEFFLVPWSNPYANGGSAYTQNRAQIGVRLLISDALSVRPYYMWQTVNLPEGWSTNEIVGISMSFKVLRTPKATP